MLGNYGGGNGIQIADIGGALDIRQKRLDADEAKRKEIRTNQLIADAIPNLRKDSPAYRLAQEDPQKFAFLAKTAGIPLNAGDQFQSMVDDTHAIAKIAGTDPDGAIQYASSLIEQRKAMGVDTTKLDSWLQLARQDSGKAIRAMQMADKTFNDDIYRKREIEDRKLAQEDRALDIQERQSRLAGSTAANQQFGGQETLKDEDGNLFFSTSKRDPRTGEVRGVVAAVDGSDIRPKGKLSMTGGYGLTATEKVNQVGAQTTANESAKDRVEAIQALPGVESNAQFVKDKVKAILDHPGREIATGASSLIPTIPGTKQADFVSRFDQLSGDAFLQAFAALKGGGAISEIEGEKAQKAINRMSRTTTKEEFDAAAKDFISIVDAGVKNKRKQAGKENDGDRQDDSPKETAAERYARLKNGN